MPGGGGRSRSPTLSRVRIGLVCPYSLTLPGGVQGQVLGLARALRAKGHEVRVLGPSDGPPPDAGVIALGKSVPFASNGSIAPIAPDVPCAVRTIWALRDESFDVVHLHEPLVPGPCLTSALMKNAPLVGTFHAAGGSTAYRWAAPVLRWVAERLDVRCAVSDDARSLAESYIPGTYEMVFNGIEPERFAGATPWPSEGRTILFVGRHEQRKGLAVLLEAAALLSDARLWIVGEGPETARLRAHHEADRRIEWLGRIDDGELARRLRGSDVFCAPSLHGESFGVVLLEAMAAGVPIVASDLDGYRRVARPDREGVLVAPGDVQALATALGDVLDHPDLAAKLAAAGRERAACFSMDALAGRYLELYEALLCRR